MTMQNILLLGAGFSRNWGGWLASEAFEYLLGIDNLDAQTRKVLWDNKDRGGFEDALAILQNESIQRGSNDAAQRLQAMQDAISQMFRDMDKAFAAIPFEPQNQPKFLEFTVASFLVRFDAIFTLNQDTLLERHYLNDNVALLSAGRWNGHQIPGMRRNPGHDPIQQVIDSWSPLSQSEFRVDENCQPFIKLHGSWNWVAGEGQSLVIMGGNKAREIERHPILSWNFELFRECLSQPDTQLMVIGYSFRDPHVDQVIQDAAARSNLQLFVVDPLGVDVLNENRNPVALINAESPRFRELKRHVIGASRRSIRATFGGDPAEHAKVMRFFR
jgi:hypothetical protein